MKAILITITVLIGLSASGYSQTMPGKQKRTAEERAKMMTEALDKKLNLSSEQESKVYELYLDRTKDMEKMRRERMEDKQERIVKNKRQADDQDKKLQKILNDDQYRMYLEQRKINKEKMKNRHPNKRDGRKQKSKV
jgi:periplasmic protein CpxP/Spy